MFYCSLGSRDSWSQRQSRRKLSAGQYDPGAKAAQISVIDTDQSSSYTLPLALWELHDILITIQYDLL